MELTEASTSFLSMGFAGSIGEESHDREDLLVNRSGWCRFVYLPHLSDCFGSFGSFGVMIAMGSIC